ncbi:helix-turn-helix transcriptional regulator [Collimonas sp.]|uniref:helix-turn-helix transcriptional regulator n=1 Tax=Collimonas sp. TaxID=1963772 RepID=UPI002CE0C7C1|nr:helix-turn-helix transcriptional regulator [Collimonas sp.]HWW99608.1 helix-turn-helix transcriptional regulator [Collimonas sp.]
MESLKNHAFTSKSPPERFKLECWTKGRGRRLHMPEGGCRQQAAFGGGTESTSLGAVVVTRYSVQEAAVDRTQSLMRSMPSLRFHLLLVEDGRHVLKQFGRTVEVASGDMVLIDAHRLSSSVQERATVARMVSLSEAFASHWIPHVEGCVAHVLKGDRGWGAMLSAYLGNLGIETLQASTSLYEQALMADQIACLMRFAFKEVGLPKTESSKVRNLRQRAELHRGMVLWLKQNYHDASVTAQTLADAFGMSVRNVHHVFLNAEGASFHSLLRDIRLDAATRLLAVKEAQALSLAEIGWRCGFSEQSHFCRVFRQQKKMSPGTYLKILDAKTRAVASPGAPYILAPHADTFY